MGKRQDIYLLRRFLLPESLNKLNGAVVIVQKNPQSKAKNPTNPIYLYSLLPAAIIFILLHLKSCYQHLQLSIHELMQIIYWDLHANTAKNQPACQLSKTPRTYTVRKSQELYLEHFLNAALCRITGKAGAGQAEHLWDGGEGAAHFPKSPCPT